MGRLSWSTREPSVRVLPSQNLADCPVYMVDTWVKSKVHNDRQKSAHRCLFPGSNPTCKTLNDCKVQNRSHGWLASCEVYRAGNPCIIFLAKNCRCKFFCSNGSMIPFSPSAAK